MLSKTAVYALRTMGYIAGQGLNEPVLSRVISEEQDIPQNFLSKIMHRLVQEGYLRSMRGINGGFSLTRDPHAISLAEIVGLFTNLNEFNGCFLGFPSCDGSCSLHKKWAPIADKFRRLLEETSIAKISIKTQAGKSQKSEA